MRGNGRWPIAGLVSIAVLVVGFCSLDWRLLSAAATLVLLSLAAIPLGWRLGGHDRRFLVVTVTGWGLRALGAVVQHALLLPRYGGGDAEAYLDRGELVADALAHGGIVPIRQLPGTGTIDLLSGLVQLLSGRSPIAVSLAFAWLAWLGTLLAMRAFEAVEPFSERSVTRYRWIVCLLPSLILWPSVVGKDAVVMLGLGVVLRGFTSSIRSQPVGGAAQMVCGLAIVAIVRPHIAGLLVLSGLLTHVVPATARRRGMRRLVAPVVLVSVLLLGAPTLSNFLRADITSPEEIASALSDVSAKSERGASVYEPVALTSPASFPPAVMSVLFRPSLIEVRSTVTAASAAESTGLMALAIYALMQRRGYGALRDAYVRFCAFYTLGFCLVFSSIGNFGILVRQRTQLLPALLAMLISIWGASPHRSASPATAPPTATVGPRKAL